MSDPSIDHNEKKLHATESVGYIRSMNDISCKSESKNTENTTELNSYTDSYSGNMDYINSKQSEVLQGQIMQYRILSKRFTDMKASLPVSTKESVWYTQKGVVCMGPSKAGEGMLGVNVGDAGPFRQMDDHPLALTVPYMQHLRERMSHSSVSSGRDNASRLWLLQRQLRADFINTSKTAVHTTLYPRLSASATAPPAHKIQPPDMYYRAKKQNKREWKQLEKEIRRKRIDRDDARRKTHNAFMKAVLSYRDDFTRFHRAKRNESAKAARAVKQWLDTLEARKEKKDNKAESKRIQALKENNMEAYIQLVQETKNSRLKYLLAQTDEYIATINRMIKDERQVTPVDQDDAGEGVDSVEAGDKASKVSKDYYKDTHRYKEKVTQPRMLQGGDLKEYQMTGLQWLVSLYNNNLNGILADEMGLGKTIQSLALLAYVMEFKHNNGPFLIVVPLSTLSNWTNEAAKWVPSMIKVIYRGTPPQRKQIYRDEVEPGQFNALFTTYEYVMKDRSTLKRIVWQYIIVDEGHRLKNANSKFAQILGTSYQSKHRILLTGTPLQNNLPELWSLLNFLLPSIFSSVETFDQWFNQPFSQFKSQGPSAGDDENDMAQLTHEERLLIVNRLHEVLRPFMLRRMKAQVLDQLPEKTETILRCEMSGWQKKLYKLIHQRTLSTVKDAVGNVSNVYGTGLNNVIMQLRKVCNHPYLFLNDWPTDDDLVRASGKFELLDRMLPKLKAAGHRVLMFSQMTQVMSILEHFFELRGYPYLRLDGSTVAEERERRMFMFNDPDSPFFVFLLSTRAGGLGLNLATADTVILFDSDWNPMMDAQAQDRAHRIGQKNEVKVFRLVTNSMIEEKILARATDKRNLTGLVVEAGKFNRSKEGAEKDGGDRKALVEALLKEYTNGNEFEEDGEAEEAAVPDDDQINYMMATNDGEAALYQQIDKRREEEREAKAAALNKTTKRPGRTGASTALPPPLMEENGVPAWAREQSAWLSKHQQLFLMSEHVEKMNISATSEGYTLADEEEESNVDTTSQDGDTGEGGRGAMPSMRKRKAVVYDDGLSDAQFVDFVERGGQPEDFAAVKRKGPKSRGPVNTGVGAAITPELSKKLQKILNDVSKIKTADGFKRFHLFIDKPDKKLYPDYYQIIETPIAIKTIQSYLKKGSYLTLGDFERDLDLMVSNARVYNEDGSHVHTESAALREEVMRRVEEVIPQSDEQTTKGGNTDSQVDGSAKKKRKPGRPPKAGSTSDAGVGGRGIGLNAPPQIESTRAQAPSPATLSTASGMESDDSGNSLRMTLPSKLFKRQQEYGDESGTGAVDLSDYRIPKRHKSRN
mmetsp:Transcript_14910/g.22432  ORF Transcript_14910/g.22432 Transcript_14910/m.22432 type:complete len:1326 (+) Transcript_14910:95-4072(+)|eukprot:CAMPEP_0185037712 /NCGR_PEP_ID=MMETSP1103-20130426/32494_1 /TAXON_ID=36769 /ORGANISM="Paraphysomonas bandaiensis, Strain Caron Lab Isolate" /LENGTH=1325 /DNA_ID=CAMNT_0027575821 /DNA_START=15 /DNA_END=3992 /DNA_ORIENTATION=+